MKEEHVGDDLREVLGENGYIGFSIKAKNTEQNSMIHSEFLAFAKAAAKNNFTKALGILLENFRDDYRFSMLAEDMADLKSRISVLETTAQPKKDEKPEAF